MNEPIHVVFWPYFEGLVDRVCLLELAFPRQSSVWVNNFDDFHHDSGAVVIINGSVSYVPTMRELASLTKNFKWMLLVSIGDEGSGQHFEWIERPNISIWVQEPKPGVSGTLEPQGRGDGLLDHDKYHRMPVGPITRIFNMLPLVQNEMKEKPLDWFCSGSIRDVAWDKATRALPVGRGNYFYSGHLSYEDYARSLASAKITVCRPTLTTPETCRVYDALEAGCIPIVGTTPCGDGWFAKSALNWSHYWEYVLGEKPPFPVIDGPDELAGAVKEVLDNWPERSRIVSSWWKDYKIRLIHTLREEVETLRSSAIRR